MSLRLKYQQARLIIFLLKAMITFTPRKTIYYRPAWKSVPMLIRMIPVHAIMEKTVIVLILAMNSLHGLKVLTAKVESTF